MPDNVVQAIADDWASELSEYPEWALQKAFRWWMSRSNEDRRRKPMPGDISERAHFEMSVVRGARLMAENFDKPSCQEYYQQSQTVKKTPVTAEAATAILKEVGFKPKRFGCAE